MQVQALTNIPHLSHITHLARLRRVSSIHASLSSRVSLLPRQSPYLRTLVLFRSFNTSHNGKSSEGKPNTHFLAVKSNLERNLAVVQKLLSVAYSLQTTNEWDKAKENYERAISLLLRFIEEHSRTKEIVRSLVTAYINMAELYVTKDDYETAEKIAKKATDLFEEDITESELDELSAAAYANVAEYMVAQEKIPPALPYARVALETFEKLFGPNHPHSIHAAILMHKIFSVVGLSMDLIQLDDKYGKYFETLTGSTPQLEEEIKAEFNARADELEQRLENEPDQVEKEVDAAIDKEPATADPNILHEHVYSLDPATNIAELQQPQPQPHPASQLQTQPTQPIQPTQTPQPTQPTQPIQAIPTSKSKVQSKVSQQKQPQKDPQKVQAPQTRLLDDYPDIKSEADAMKHIEDKLNAYSEQWDDDDEDDDDEALKRVEAMYQNSINFAENPNPQTAKQFYADMQENMNAFRRNTSAEILEDIDEACEVTAEFTQSSKLPENDKEVEDMIEQELKTIESELELPQFGDQDDETFKELRQAFKSTHFENEERDQEYTMDQEDMEDEEDSKARKLRREKYEDKDD